MVDHLPDPPVPDDVDLRTFDDMPVDVARLRSSDMQVEVTPEEGWYGFMLWCAAWHQVPASSLPDDDVKLAFLAGLGRDKRTWKRVRSGALRGFEKCSNGRLYHFVIAEKAMKAWEVKRARIRGAELTNARPRNGQPTEKPQNQSRSPSRSIYRVRDAERNGSETPSADPAGRSGTATELNRTEQSRSATPPTPSSRPEAAEPTAGVDGLADEIWDMAGQGQIRDRKRASGGVDDYRHIRGWVDKGYTPEEIRQAAKAVIESAGEIHSLWGLLVKAMPEAIAKLRGQAIGAAPDPALAGIPTLVPGFPATTQLEMAKSFLLDGKVSHDMKAMTYTHPKPPAKRRWTFKNPQTQEPFPPPGKPGCPVHEQILERVAQEFGAAWP